MQDRVVATVVFSHNKLPGSQRQEAGVSFHWEGESVRKMWQHIPVSQVPANLCFMTDTSAQGHIHSSHRWLPPALDLHSNHPVCSVVSGILFPLLGVYSHSTEDRVNIARASHWHGCLDTAPIIGILQRHPFQGGNTIAEVQSSLLCNIQMLRIYNLIEKRPDRNANYSSARDSLLLITSDNEWREVGNPNSWPLWQRRLEKQQRAVY